MTNAAQRKRATGVAVPWLVFLFPSAFPSAVEPKPAPVEAPARDVCMRSAKGVPHVPPSAGGKTSFLSIFEGEGALYSEALADAKMQFARKLAWPSRAEFPEAVAATSQAIATCVVNKGTRVRVQVSFPAPEAVSAFARLAAQEAATLDTLTFLASHASLPVGTRFAGSVSLQEHLARAGRAPLPALLSACETLASSACKGLDIEAETRAVVALENARKSLEFRFTPEDEVARSLLAEVDSTLQARGLRVRDPSVTDEERQLKARCQRVILPGVEGQNLRIIELVCEADALVKGSRVATMRFLGRGQDVNHDDAVLDARRRLAVDEFRFASNDENGYEK